MSTFDLVVKKITSIDNNNIFLPKYNNNDNIYFIDKFFLNDFLLELKDKSKFMFLQEITENFYYKNNLQKNNLTFLFNKIQKIYHILNRLIIRYKYKKSKIIINTDLQLNFINENDKNIICIFHNNLKYLFNINDILKLIYTSLTNSHLFFSQPLCIKNPYNNIPFGKSILYYIYYFLTNNITISSIQNKYIDIFLKFKECNFNMTKFVNHYEYIIRDYSIKNYIKNSTKLQLRIEIEEMINQFNINKKNNKKIIIDKDFPNDKLIQIMRPYLYLKISGEYSLINLVEINSKAILNKKLIEFQNFNPKFGRKILKIKYKSQNGIKIFDSVFYKFIDNNKKFNVYDIKQFMNNHLSYKENNSFDLIYFTTIINNINLNNTNPLRDNDEQTIDYDNVASIPADNTNDDMNDDTDDDDDDENDSTS
jgi:hypothetical protein